MNRTTPPLIINPQTLSDALEDHPVVIIDLSEAVSYQQNHIPNAIHLTYADIVSDAQPIVGLLPDAAKFGQLLSCIGISPQSHVVAYDNEGNLKACRFLWTLAMIGHQNCALLDGGLQAWIRDYHPISQARPKIYATHYPVVYQQDHCATKAFILEHLNDPNVIIIDARSANEHQGYDKRADRAGHIPGAINIEWTQAQDANNHRCIKNDDELLKLYENIGVTKDKTIVVYCQSHRRSAHSYVMLKHLGYPDVRGYPGSWSEWGNNPDTPIEP